MTEPSHINDQPSGSGESRTAAEAPDAYGRFVDKHVVAVNHDHYFNFRLDVDMDGASNSFVADP